MDHYLRMPGSAISPYGGPKIRTRATVSHEVPLCAGPHVQSRACKIYEPPVVHKHSNYFCPGQERAQLLMFSINVAVALLCRTGTVRYIILSPWSCYCSVPAARNRLLTPGLIQHQLVYDTSITKSCCTECTVLAGEVGSCLPDLSN